MPEELWTDVYNIVPEAETKIIPNKKYTRRQSGCLRRVLQIPEEEKDVKGKGERQSYNQLNTES